MSKVLVKAMKPEISNSEFTPPDVVPKRYDFLLCNIKEIFWEMSQIQFFYTMEKANGQYNGLVTNILQNTGLE